MVYIYRNRVAFGHGYTCASGYACKAGAWAPWRPGAHACGSACSAVEDVGECAAMAHESVGDLASLKTRAEL